MSNLTIVPIQNGLAQDVRRVDVRVKVIARINELGLNLTNYRMNNEFLLLVLNLIEHLVVKKDKLNKKEVAIEILDQLFTLTPSERVNVDSNIEFLWSNKNIKKVSYWKLFKCGVSELFLKRK